jgi:AcrR family transcriptional regulator
MSTKRNFRDPIQQPATQDTAATLAYAPATPARPREGEIVPDRPEAHAEGRRERHRRETFERLVNAAREIMFNRGLADMTVQDITEAADVGKGTFFNYFQSKEHVVSRVSEFSGQSLVQAVERVRQGQESAIVALRNVIRETMCRPGNWLTYESNTLRALVMNEDVRSLMSTQLRVNRHAYEMLVALGQEQGTIRRDMPVAQIADVAQTLLAGFTVVLWIHGTTPTEALVDSMFQALDDLVKPVASTPRTRPAEPGRAVRRPAAPAAAPKPGARSKQRTRR